MSSIASLELAFDLLEDGRRAVRPSEQSLERTLKTTYTRRLLELMKSIDRSDERLCLAVSRLIMMKAFPFAVSVCEHDASLAAGYNAIRDSWQEWGAIMVPLIGPEAKRHARLYSDA
ncbi:MAG: hypothetical protein LC097_00850 [Burkholderiales bacterium]|nr:hypothetical protein [Burkholderiales bacterium]